MRKKGRREEVAVQTWAGLNKPLRKVRLQELTTALVACLHDPQYIRETGIEEIFEGLFEEEKEELYRKLYPDSGRDVDDYVFCLLCYSLAGRRMTIADTPSRTVENHGRYYVAYLLYHLLGHLYAKKVLGKKLLRALGMESRHVFYADPVIKMRNAIARAWMKFYQQRGHKDVRAFVSKVASKGNWDQFFFHAKAAAKHRRDAKRYGLVLARSLAA